MISTPESLAENVVKRRTQLGFRSREVLAQKSGVSSRTIGDIENGRKPSYALSTLWSLDEALGWKRGTAYGLLNGDTNIVLTEERASEDAQPVRLIDVLAVGEDRLEGLSDADVAEIELVAKLAASERARDLQARNREVIAAKSVEEVHRRVDTRSASSSESETQTI